ncbi:MAG: UPF0182 family protein [Acidobacteria bacterium]|nr:UPF0182 family protein [Acidobacteriota bacterium]
MSLTGKRWLWLAVVFFVALVLLPNLVWFASDWWWFQEVGYESVFLRILTVQAGLFFLVLTFSFVAFYLNLRVALRVAGSWEFVVPQGAGEGVPPVRIVGRQVLRLGGIASAILALLLATNFMTQWPTWLQYLHATPFRENDPIFGRDVGFYIFQLPLLELVRGLAKILVGMAVIVSFVIYYLSGKVTWGARGRIGIRATVSPGARIHLSLLASAVFLLLALGAYVDLASLLMSSGGPVQGATYADVEARRPLLYALGLAALAGALLALLQAYWRSLKPIVAGAGLYALVSVALWIYPALLQRLVVAPNELVKETPFILNNIAATRTAFGLESVGEREISGDQVLTMQEIRANDLTIKNVRLWDHRPLLDTFGQIQEIRTYYDFVSVDNDRYWINGEYRQTMLSARELAAESLPQRNWINEHLIFTHGFGLTLGPVNQVTPEGLPVLMIQDLPPKSRVPSIQVTVPELYFGEVSNDYVFVNTRQPEFNYPAGEQNVYSTYGGKAGVSVGSFLRKLAFSLRFHSLKTLLSGDIHRESRILFYRNIEARVRRIAPFLRYDRDPYLVISQGRLIWLLDAYTSSTRYPYSQPLPDGTNYIRNSVKISIDAYEGTTRFYVADDRDPILRTYRKIFPELFRPLEEMPADLRTHLRYPQDIFTIQTSVYATYHMDDPQVFYNREDQWEVPVLDGGAEGQAMEPYYTIMRLPGEKAEEFILMLPFTPKRKDNLSAWMVARADGAHYGTLLVYRFPKQKLIYGPRQIVARINQDAQIAGQITLWDQRGSQVIQGTLLVIPIEESLLYVRPLYLRAEAGKIPELKRVIVAHENKIAMEETLEMSLAQIFGASPERRPEVREAAAQIAPAERADLVAQAKQHYERALRAQREGHWATYGEEIRELGNVLARMEEKK